MIKSTLFKTFLACYLILMGAASCTEKVEQSSQLPNILFILVDDLGYGDVACYNPDSRIPTPNIDQMAAEGVMFTDAHSPSTVCTPTRYSILTGRMAFRTGHLICQFAMATGNTSITKAQVAIIMKGKVNGE
jgi:hypothetical protein